MFYLDPVTPDLFSDAPVNFAALILVIEREIRVFLKDPNFAHPLGTDPAGGDIRHTTIFEMKPRVGDIFVTAEHRDADRVDTPKRRAYKMENDLQVVDHQIEYDADIRAAFRVRREPMRFYKSRMGQMFFERAEHWVKTFDMTHLQYEIAARCQFRELGRLRGIVGDRLLN